MYEVKKARPTLKKQQQYICVKTKNLENLASRLTSEKTLGQWLKKRTAPAKLGHLT
jgi:hypothetical protein